MELIKPYKLTEPQRVYSLVEQHNKYNLDFCELNLFETRQVAKDFKLQFSGFTITSMLRGKKVMQLSGRNKFDYLPGETVIAPPNTLMSIDFPIAEFEKPTQCTALEIDTAYLSDKLSQINDMCAKQHQTYQEKKIDINDVVLRNNNEFARLSNKLLQVCTSDDPFKEFQADIVIRELVLAMLKIQNLNKLKTESDAYSNGSPFNAVISFIKTELNNDIRIDKLCKIACMSKSSFYRAFTETFGVTPSQLILEMRINYAKELIDQNRDICLKEVAYASGFNDPNYFSRTFKKMEGCTASEYKLLINNNYSS